MEESKLLCKDKDVVVPGEVLAEGMDFFPSFGTYRLENTIRANRLGMVKIDGKVLKLIPLTGRYNPRYGDTVIGKVTDILMMGWRLNVNCAYEALLSVREISRGPIDMSKFYELGDYIVCKIVKVTNMKYIDVTTRGPGLRKLSGGRIFEVNTHKVPRIIGKQGSMVMMIKDATGCKIVVGQNGFVWLEGDPEMEVIAVEAIKKIEKESHLEGLTERIKEFLEKKTKGKIKAAEKESKETEEEQEISD